MALNIWFKEDIENVLLSINVASAAAVRLSDDAQIAAYRQGFEEALVTVAMALGIQPTRVRPVAASGNGGCRSSEMRTQ